MFASYRANKVSYSEQYYCSMTDALSGFDIKPIKKICLVTDINPDGIGDLMLQIRAYEILNRQFHGLVQCITFAATKYIEKYREIAREYGFETTFHDYLLSRSWTQNILSEQEYELIIQISYVGPSQPVLNPKIRHYILSEIKFHHPLTNRDKTGYLGFMPEGEGLFQERITRDKDTFQMLRELPVSIKKHLNMPCNMSSDQARHWYQTSWIAQSCHYEHHHFIVSLISQLFFIKDSCKHIEHVFIKYGGISRNGKPWKLADILKDKMLEAMFQFFNIKNLILDSTSIFSNQENKITLNIFSEYFSKNDYHQYLKLVNGCHFPSGDNSYCEAWSNDHTTLPPFPELRDYKQSSLNPLFDLIDHLDIDQNHRTFLHDHIMGCLFMHTRVNANSDITALIQIGRRISKAWALAKDPRAAWQALSLALSKQSLNDRIIHITKEQLMFAKHPDLANKKQELIESEKDNCIIKYKEIVSALLEPMPNACRCSLKV